MIDDELETKHRNVRAITNDLPSDSTHLLASSKLILIIIIIQNTIENAQRREKRTSKGSTTRHIDSGERFQKRVYRILVRIIGRTILRGKSYKLAVIRCRLQTCIRVNHALTGEVGQAFEIFFDGHALGFDRFETLDRHAAWPPVVRVRVFICTVNVSVGREHQRDDRNLRFDRRTKGARLERQHGVAHVPCA